MTSDRPCTDYRLMRFLLEMERRVWWYGSAALLTSLVGPVAAFVEPRVSLESVLLGSMTAFLSGAWTLTYGARRIRRQIKDLFPKGRRALLEELEAVDALAASLREQVEAGGWEQ